MWKFDYIWNSTFEGIEDKPYEPRQHMWASELYKPDIDIWLRMKGEQPTNQPNYRSKRKFEAGNTWEWIIELILRRTGLYESTQDRVEFEKDGHIKVTGKIDFIAGGKINEKHIEIENLPDIYRRVSEDIIEQLSNQYPDGLPKQILEIKSTSSFAFDRIEATGKALQGHALQLFHYVYNTGMPGMIVYVCRDDCRIICIEISKDDEKLEKAYFAKLKRIYDYYHNDEQPPIEPLIVWEDGKFSKNFGVEYSGYLTKLYTSPLTEKPYKEPIDYYEEIGPLVTKWNRVVKRIAEGKDMTDKNNEIIEEAKSYGFDLEKLTKEYYANQSK